MCFSYNVQFFLPILLAVLALFFKEVLNFDDDVSTLLYHAFTAICYFTPIFGAILADSFVGKFRTIFYISIIYAIGQIVLTIGAVGNTENGNEGISGLPAKYVLNLFF
jgi:solute carrier family 15 oligopeptide transporter 1